MADRVESTVSNNKYLELAFEYSKLKDKFRQLGVLGQRIIGEKENAVADVVQIDRQLRQSNQENENLKFHNNQLTIRVKVLQDELKVLQQQFEFDQRGMVRDTRGVSLATTSNMHMDSTQHSLTNMSELTDVTRQSHLNEGINTFVEVTKNQVANMANENEQLVHTIQTMRSEFDVELTERNNEIEQLKRRLADIEKQSPAVNNNNNNNLISSLYHKVSLNNYFFNKKSPVDVDKVDSMPSIEVDQNNCLINGSPHMSIFITASQLFDPHYIGLNFNMIPSRISRKKLKSCERIIISCLRSFVEVINNICNDITETIRNSSQSTHQSGLNYYDFSTALSLIQMASVVIDEYDRLAAMNQNRFILIYDVINKCCTSLTMIDQLLQFHFSYLTPIGSSNTMNTNQLHSFPKIHLLQMLQKYLSIISVSFKNLFLCSPTSSSILNLTEENQMKQVVFDEIQNTLKLFVKYLNGSLNSVIIDNNQIISTRDFNGDTLDHITSSSNQQLYLTLNSLLKTRANHMIDVLNMFLLVVENEQDILQNYGWFSSHMTTINQLSHSNNEITGRDGITLCGFEKIIYAMENTNNQLKTSHLKTIDQLIPHGLTTTPNDVAERSDKNNTHYMKSLKENYLQLQNQLMTTIKKLDEITNNNELLQFKLKTSTPLDPNLSSVACGASDQTLPTNEVLDELKNYVQQRVSLYQCEYRKILSHLCVLLSDWQAMKFRWEDCQKSLKTATNEVSRYKNEHSALSAHILSMKESYEKNVVELTEKLSLCMAAQVSNKSRK